MDFGFSINGGRREKGCRLEVEDSRSRRLRQWPRYGCAMVGYGSSALHCRRWCCVVAQGGGDRRRQDGRAVAAAAQDGHGSSGSSSRT
jgi:hypothetical protein